ncbi:unnamed protein product [Prunus armeniaca]|uniref:HMA domain-containing protein n=1 Tax=Prunus armeniaca TaxID=36596 RepID=A0A6J5WW39_PRUAR|nr:unnamed protein product [Prunus armeniaca]
MGRQLTFGVLFNGCKKDKKKAGALEKEITGVLKKFDGVHLREFDFGQGKLVVEVADNTSDSNLLTIIKALQKIKKVHSVDLMKDEGASEKSQPQQRQLNKNMEAGGGKPKKAVTFILPEEEEEESDADAADDDDDDDEMPKVCMGEIDKKGKEKIGWTQGRGNVGDMHQTANMGHMVQKAMMSQMGQMRHVRQMDQMGLMGRVGHLGQMGQIGGCYTGPMGSYPVGPAAQGMMGYGYGYGYDNYYNHNQGQYMNMMPAMGMDEGRANWNDNDMNNNTPMPSQQEQAMDPYTYFSEENANGCAIM